MHKYNTETHKMEEAKSAQHNWKSTIRIEIPNSEGMSEVEARLELRRILLDDIDLLGDNADLNQDS